MCTCDNNNTSKNPPNKPFDEVKTVRCKVMVKIFVSIEVRKHLYIVILYHMLIKYVCAVSIECHVQ